MSKKPKMTTRDGKPVVFPPTWGQVKPVKPTKTPRKTTDAASKIVASIIDDDNDYVVVNRKQCDGLRRRIRDAIKDATAAERARCGELADTLAKSYLAVAVTGRLSHSVVGMLQDAEDLARNIKEPRS